MTQPGRGIAGIGTRSVRPRAYPLATSCLLSLVLILICGVLRPGQETKAQGHMLNQQRAENLTHSSPSLPSLLHNEPWAVIQPSVFLDHREMRGSQFALEKNSIAFEDAPPF